MTAELPNDQRELDTRSRRIDLAHHGDFDLDALKVQPSLRKISGPLGEQVLEPKVMQVLIALTDPIGTILSRDDLIERCWDGRVVGDTSINRVISLLRNGLRETVGELVCVETVPKVGYRVLVNQAECGDDDADGFHECLGPITLHAVFSVVRQSRGRGILRSLLITSNHTCRAPY